MEKLKCLTISVELEGYEKMKQQLRNIEATMDRIIEKQEIIGSRLNTKPIEVKSELGRTYTAYGIDELHISGGLDVEQLIKELKFYNGMHDYNNRKGRR